MILLNSPRWAFRACPLAFWNCTTQADRIEYGGCKSITNGINLSFFTFFNISTAPKVKVRPDQLVRLKVLQFFLIVCDFL